MVDVQLPAWLLWYVFAVKKPIVSAYCQYMYY